MLQKKYTTRNRRPSYAFLMEMLWVCGFFAVLFCLYIFVLAFVKTDSMSRRAGGPEPRRSEKLKTDGRLFCWEGMTPGSFV